MARYRKKPVVVEAFQWFREMGEAGGVYKKVREDVSGGNDHRSYWMIDTLEGSYHVSDGDYIITGIKGEKYPCKPDIFEKTYELVEE